LKNRADIFISYTFFKHVAKVNIYCISSSFNYKPNINHTSKARKKKSPHLKCCEKSSSILAMRRPNWQCTIININYAKVPYPKHIQLCSVVTPTFCQIPLLWSFFNIFHQTTTLVAYRCSVQTCSSLYTNLSIISKACFAHLTGLIQLDRLTWKKT
jgi:hypothetical protein